MLDSSAITKTLFTKLEKATAAVPPEHITEGRPQNPLSTMHWTMENHGAGYRFTMMRGGVIVSQKTVDLNEITTVDAKGRRVVAPQETIDALVASMFEKVPAKKAA